MELPPYPAISLFCSIISDLPESSRRTTLTFTCSALGKFPDPTGIEVSPDRKIRHLYWDHETKDLYDRLVYLVEKVGLDEIFAVKGAISFVEYHFARWSDQGSSDSNVAAFRQLIDKLEHQLTLPVSQRDEKQTDEEIQDFIEKLLNNISTADMRVKDAEDTLQYLHSRFEETFTLQFWDALTMLRIQQSAPYLDELFGRFDDEKNGNDQV